MLQIGKYNQLNVLEAGVYGIILDGLDHGRLLLSRRLAPENVDVGESLEVFVFLDAQGDPVPTTDRPAATVGQVAWLEVVEVNEVGAFVDWGLSKDLFIPFAEQQHALSKGRHTLVKVYLDNQGRLAGSTRIDHWIKDEPGNLTRGEKVDVIVGDKTELGFKAIINHESWGLLYSNELFQRISKGQHLEAFVNRVRKDGKIDLSLTQPGFSQGKMDKASAAVLAAMEANQGFLPLTDKSPPEEIYARFKFSKKVFKQAVGVLYKARRITLESDGMRLNQ